MQLVWVHLSNHQHLTLLDTVTTREADNQEDDKYQNQDHQHNQNFHLHVLPPHFAAQLSSSLVKLVRLHYSLSSLRKPTSCMCTTCKHRWCSRQTARSTKREWLSESGTPGPLATYGYQCTYLHTCIRMICTRLHPLAAAPPKLALGASNNLRRLCNIAMPACMYTTFHKTPWY